MKPRRKRIPMKFVRVSDKIWIEVKESIDDEQAIREYQEKLKYNNESRNSH